jgi:hypothetical protein
LAQSGDTGRRTIRVPNRGYTTRRVDSFTYTLTNIEFFRRVKVKRGKF